MSPNVTFHETDERRSRKLKQNSAQ